MKTSKIVLGLFILITSAASAAYAQQQFTQTVTTQNRSTVVRYLLSQNSITISAPLIFVTTVLEEWQKPNPHPIDTSERGNRR
jgi:hypothetical protein